jgi:hypothetical protein
VFAKGHVVVVPVHVVVVPRLVVVLARVEVAPVAKAVPDLRREDHVLDLGQGVDLDADLDADHDSIVVAVPDCKLDAALEYKLVAEEPGSKPAVGVVDKVAEPADHSLRWFRLELQGSNYNLK